MTIGNVEATNGEYLVADKCPKCNKMSEIKITLYQKVFMLGLPMFPHDKYTKSVCDSCKGQINKNELPEFVKQKAKSVLLNSKPIKWAFSGPVILVIVSALALIFGLKSQKEYNAYIQNPQVGDIYVIEYEDPEALFYKERYTVWKVKSMDEEHIFFEESILEVEEIEDIDKMLEMTDDNVWVESYNKLTKTYLEEKTSLSAMPPSIYKIVR